MTNRFGFVAAALMVWAVGAAAAPSGKLTVHFSGIEEFKGNVLISLADSREIFESDDKVTRSAVVPADARRVTAIFDALPAGDYAVKIFQDADGNQKLDIGLMGPKEKYGFSNNVMGFMGPPDFDDAKFSFDGSELEVEIEAR